MTEIQQLIKAHGERLESGWSDGHGHCERLGFILVKFKLGVSE